MDLLFANVPENILLFDGEGRLAQCSTYFLRLAGIDHFEQVVGWHFTRLYRLFGDEDFVSGAVSRFEHVKEGRKTFVGDVLLNFAAQREERLYSVHSAPMLTEEGLLDGVIVVFHDSTEHVRQEADERTRAMLNASPLASSLWSEAIEPLDCNDVTLRMFGLASVEEFQHRILDLMPSEQPDGENSGEAFYGLIRQAFESGWEKREIQSQMPSGEPIPTELTFVRIKWGNKYGVVCFSRDLRVLRASQTKMREADERTRVMLDAMPLACSFWDEDINLIDCNHECLVLFGLNSKEAYLRRFWELSPEFQPDGVASREKIIANTQAAFQIGRQEYEWLHWNPATGRRFPTEVVLVRVPWKDGYRVVSYVRDMSEIRVSDEKRREAEARSRELEVQTRAAKVASEAKSHFLATMSHEIRTPMNAIIGMSELIRTNNLDDTQQDFINDIRKMSHSLLHIINGILDFSKIEAGKLELAPVHFDLMELYDNICSINRFAAESRNLHFTASFAQDVPRVLYGDDVRIRQVITNILGNAIKYTPRGGVEFKVERVEQAGSWLAFTVTDTGIGIRQEDIPRLFDTFAQFDRKNNRTQVSTGLGLSITQSLVRLMQGHIEVKSEYGQGSTFAILLPLTPGDPAQVETAVQQQPEFRASDARVLVVDDNQINLKVALAHLANYGIHADTAMSGREAIAKVERKDYDLVLMDQMMPGMDGLEATQRIRALAEKYRKLSIVALTANAVRGAEQTFLGAGMNDFISKPINTNELSHILMKWLPAGRVSIATNVAHSSESDRSALPLVPISGIQRELGLKNAAGDESLYRQLLADFIQDHADDATRLREHLAAGKQADAHRLAHTLKSVAATIGALDLQQAAANLENALKENRQDEALLAALATHLATVTAELEAQHAFRATPPAPAPSASLATVPDYPDPAAALALLDKLDPLLANGNTAVLEYITDIQYLLSPLNEYCGLLIKQIEDFDFSCARQTSLSIRNIMATAPTHRRTT